ncbi:MAG TPA: phospholipase D-like domain-containing protein [Gammaproteobacteria bacterium]
MKRQRAAAERSAFHIGRFNNHQKLLIVDEIRVVCGSHNWLSNRAFENREKSFIIEDPVLAQNTFACVTPLITANAAAVT